MSTRSIAEVRARSSGVFVRGSRLIAAAILIGWSLLSKGRSNLKARNLALSRTAESLHRDREFAGEQVERIRHEAAAGTTPSADTRNETTRKEAAQ